MSFLDLYDFNGSIKRNKCQEAVFSSMNSRDAFLKSVEEQRKSRALDTKQRQAALRIQRCWRGYRARGRVMDAVRCDFDATVADSEQTLLTQMTRVALFYRWSTEGDNGRLIKVCGDALSLHRLSPLAIRKPLKLFFCRRVLEFISRASGEVLFTMPVRFLETFLEAADYTHLTEKTKLGYFSPFLTLIAQCAPPRQQDSTIHLEDYLPGRLNTLCGQLTAPFVKVGETEKKSLLTSLLCDVFSHRNHLTMTTVVIPFLLRTQNKSYSAMDLVSGVESSFRKLHMHEDICLAEDSFDSLLPSLLMTLLVEKKCFANESDNSFVLHVLALVIPLKMRVGGEESDNREEAMEADHNDQDELFLMSFLRENVERCLKSLAFFNIIKSAVSSSASDLDSILAFEKRLTISTSLHNTITSTGFLTRLFNHLKQMGSSERSVFSSTSRVTPHLERLKGGWSLPEDARLRLLPALSLFCSIVSSFMSSLLDDELLPGGAAAMLLPAIVASTRELRDVCLGLIDLAFPEDFWSTRTQADKKKRESAQWSSVYEKVVVTLRDVYRKNARVGFLPDNFWTDHNRQVVVNRVTWQSNSRGRGRRGHVSSSTTPRPFAFVRYLRDTQHQKGGALVQSDSEEEGIDEVPPSSSDMRNLSIVKSIPFVILFQQRLKIFQELLSYDKEMHGVEDDFGMHRRSSVSVSVRRQHLYEDAFDSLTPGKVPNLRLPVRVHMINWVGTDEIGEDGGGIFREFLSELLKTGFDRNRGLFSYTHDGLLYPNPASIALYPGIFSQHFYFLGRMVAKLIYEGQMMDMRFADFFLVQLLGSRMTSIDLEQMKSYDPSVYKHLRGLLSCSAEEIDQLGLDFSVLVDTLGTVETKDLKPGGRNIRVTVENRMEYIQLYVNFFLYKRMEPLVDAMRHGVSDVIDPVWLAMFDPSELQMIVSGVDADVDIEDMRRNCVVYNANDAENERYMTLFWQVAKELSREDKAALLKFITGCSRPPIEGFRHLNPPMGIQLISGADLLPMSATCMNLFKLPKYSNRQMIEEKLRYAINSGAGFEMQ